MGEAKLEAVQTNIFKGKKIIKIHTSATSCPSTTSFFTSTAKIQVAAIAQHKACQVKRVTLEMDGTFGPLQTVEPLHLFNTFCQEGSQSHHIMLWFREKYVKT